MTQYEVTVQLVVRLELFAESRAMAIQKATDMVAGTQSWQAWGEGLAEDAVNWVDQYPIIVSVS